MKTGRLILRWFAALTFILPVVVVQAQPESVCAQVTIQLNQDAVIARSAFRGTLKLADGGTTPLTQVSVVLSLLDANRQPADAVFGVKPPKLTGLNAINGSGTLAAGASGSVEWTIVPTRDAAASGTTQYYVGGTLSYVQNSVQVTVPLYPAPISVVPDASLVVKYFQQRDVYSDDPFTPQVEPAEPFALGLLMTNNGLGTAHHVTITSAQPQIIENQKGLLVAFKIIGTEVEGEPIAPSLTAALGDIGPGASAEAVWLMTSSLQGEFTNYDASYRQVDDFGNSKTSLIDHVEIHELLHVVRIDQPADDHLPDFLANDHPNASPLPDMLYSSDGTTYPVSSSTTGNVSGAPEEGAMEVTLTAPMAAGWAYLEIDDPSGGNFPLVSVHRSDGREILVGENAWTTHRTKHPVGEAASTEKRLHLLDFNSTGSYVLTFGAVPIGVQFLSDTYTVPQGPRTAAVTVQRTGNTTGSLTVNYLTADGTATAGVDYTAAHGTLSFVKGQTTKSISVPILKSKSTPQVQAGKAFSISLSDVTGGGALVTPSVATITIVDTTLRSFASYVGVYSGLFQTGIQSEGLAGSLKITVAATGRFTATVLAGGKTYRLSGRFDNSGSFAGKIAGGKTGAILVTLQLDLLNGTNQVTGTLTQNGFTADLGADRNVYAKVLHPAPEAGAYTISFPHPSDPALPQGDGYGSVKVDAAGQVTLRGVLGDGTKVSQATTLSQLGAWPMYVSLPGGKGAASGVLTFGDQAGTATLTGSVNWFSQPTKPYPAGFSTPIIILGSKYLIPPKGTRALDLGSLPNNGTVTLGGGDLTGTLTETVTLGADNTVVASSLTDAFKMRITPSTGLFQGSFLGADKKIRLFNGVLLQTQVQGSGLFLHQGESGYVELKPAP